MTSSPKSSIKIKSKSTPATLSIPKYRRMYPNTRRITSVTIRSKYQVHRFSGSLSNGVENLKKSLLSPSISTKGMSLLYCKMARKYRWKTSTVIGYAFTRMRSGRKSRSFCGKCKKITMKSKLLWASRIWCISPNRVSPNLRKVWSSSPTEIQKVSTIMRLLIWTDLFMACWRSLRKFTKLLWLEAHNGLKGLSYWLFSFRIWCDARSTLKRRRSSESTKK